MAEVLNVLTYEGSLKTLPRIGRLILLMPLDLHVVAYSWEHRLAMADLYIRPELSGIVNLKLKHELNLTRMRELDLSDLYYGMQLYVARGTVSGIVSELRQLFLDRQIRVIEAS